MAEEAGEAPTIIAARYVPDGERLVINFSSGVMVAIPAPLIEGLEALDAAARAEVEILDEGRVLRWGSGLHLSVLAITMDILGARSQATRLAEPITRRLKERRERGALKRPRR